jgi:uridine kinase
MVQEVSARGDVVRRLAALIEETRCDHPVRVAVDGPDAAGKTMLADDIARVLSQRGRIAIRASVDGFHRPRKARYRQGPNSARGYFEDSFDYSALRTLLLEPLGPDGDRMYRARAFDYRSDTPVSEPPLLAPSDAVLVFDGVFLLRRELQDAWDFSIFVSATFGETLRRAQLRDSPRLGSPEEVERRYRERYIPGQEIYFAEATPIEYADAIIINDDPTNPVLRTT